MCITNLGKQSCECSGFWGKNPYVSESLKLTGSKSTGVTPAMYKENLESLISSLSFADYEKYEEPEYKEAVKKYQQNLWLKMMH